MSGNQTPKGHEDMVEEIVKQYEQKLRTEQERFNRFENNNITKNEQIMKERDKIKLEIESYQKRLKDANQMLLERCEVEKERDLLNSQYHKSQQDLLDLKENCPASKKNMHI